MKNVILMAALALCMGACTALENYQFGDVTRTALHAAEKVITLKAQYCASDNAEAREVLLRSIRLVEPDYLGVCHAVAP